MSRSAGRQARRIAVVTGTRAEYGLLISPMRAINAHPALELQVVVTGMHLLPKFGFTVRQVERDGWRIAARIPMQSGSDSRCDQAEGLGRGVAGIARFLVRARSDIVVVLGDRIEAMAGALAAVATGRVLAHIHGGDVAPGDFDDSLRHAITKLAHVHFAATRDAARRIVRLGEDPRRVYVVGAPGLDRLRELLAEENLLRAPAGAEGSRAREMNRGSPIGVADGRERRALRPGTALVTYHACGRPAVVEGGTMDAILRAVAASGLRRLITYPNSDRGHSGVLTAIERHRRSSRPGEVEVLKSMARDDFLRALIHADVLVGNSSAGVIEAPLAGTPSVNVGPRQAGRQPGGPTVIPAKESYPAIRAAIRAALRCRARPPRSSVYGDGRAGERIASALARIPLSPGFTRKVIAY